MTGVQTCALPICTQVINAMGDDYVLIYKFHPLMDKATLEKHPRVFNMFNEETSTLMMMSDYMISDYSSIVFDYCILEKPLIFFIPDYEDYQKNRGVFVEVESFKCPMCFDENDVINALKKEFDHENMIRLKSIYFKNHDHYSTRRVVELIEGIIDGENHEKDCM